MKTFRTFLLTGLTAALLGMAPVAGLHAQPVPPPEVPAAPEPPAAPVIPEEPAAPDAPSAAMVRSGYSIRFGRDIIVSAGERVSEAIAIFGSVVSDGTIDQEAVAILGDVTVNGTVNRGVLAVLGNVHINGEVNRDVVAVLGGVQLGPNAVVRGEVLAIGGGVDRAPGAVVTRDSQSFSFLNGAVPQFNGLKAWITECLLLGRPLAINSQLGWAWVVAGSFLGFYLLIVLLFGRGVTTCAETMERSPGLTVVTSLLAMMLVPLLTVLLAVTGIGPVLLGFAVMMGTLFGKAVFITWLGRRVTVPFGSSGTFLAALIGGVILTLLYLVPYLGLVMWNFSGVLGLGMVVHTVISAMNRERPAPVQPPAIPRAAGGFAVVSPAGTMAGGVPMPRFTGPETGVDATLPRAGFWIRIAASLLDLILVGMVAVFVDPVGEYFVPVFAGYCLVLWALKGTTIGGIICGLKVVRLDGRDMDWTIALVRCLGAFLSLVAAGLGFIWAAFDDDRQSWHDKIAGTTIVRVPKGTPLV